jgi:hypothetical protein
MGQSDQVLSLRDNKKIFHTNYGNVPEVIKLRSTTK